MLLSLVAIPVADVVFVVCDVVGVAVADNVVVADVIAAVDVAVAVAVACTWNP